MQTPCSARLRLTTVVSILGLAAFAWSGCDRSEKDEASSRTPKDEKTAEESASSDEANSSENPTPSESANAPSAGDSPGEGAAGTKEPSGRTSAQPDQMEHPAKAPGGEITDEELEEFAAVNRKLRPHMMKLSKKMKAAESRAEKKKIRMQLMAATRQAVQKSSLDSKRFSMIAKQLKRDPQLQNRIRSLSNPPGATDADK